MRFAAAIPLLMLFCAPALGATYTVLADGTGDFPTIQAAMSAAANGDVIQLGDGEFTGPGNRDLDTNETTFSLVSISGDPVACVINCQGTVEDPHYGIAYSTQGPAALLRGISIINAHTPFDGGALNLANASPTVENCRFISNVTDGRGGAVFGNDWPEPVFTGCLFSRNIAYGGSGGAVHLEDHVDAGFIDCTFIGNMADRGGALAFDAVSLVQLDQCTIVGSVGGAVDTGNLGSFYLARSIVAFNQGMAVNGMAGSSASSYCSDVYSNSNGSWTGLLSGQLGASGNIEADPQFCDRAAGDLTLFVTSICADAPGGCGLMGAWPVGCWNTITVAPDGSGDFPTIQAAVDAATSDTDEIVLLDGVYSGPGNYDVNLRGKAITLRSQSDDPTSCVLDRGYWLGDMGAFVCDSGEGQDTVIRGLTMRDFTRFHGGAIYVAGASPTIENCLFINNEASASGGAVWTSGSSLATPVTMRDCGFLDNRTSDPASFGGAAYFTSNVSLQNCWFRGNTAGPADNQVGSYGGALVVGNYITVEITGCTFQDNGSGGGGAIIAVGPWDSFDLSHCTFVGNAGEGSAIFVDTGDMTVSDCIIAGGTGGAPIAAYDNNEAGSTVVLVRNDVFANEGGDWVGIIADQASLNGNFSANPVFCDTEAGELTLESSSPCAPLSAFNATGQAIGACPVGCTYSGVVTSVADVPADQGRRVRLSWNRSSQDGPGTPYDVLRYTVWRRIDDPARKAVPAPAGVACHADKFPAGDWDYVATVPARGEPRYSLLCETVADSTITDGMHWSTFFVSAETDQAYVFFDAAPDSGWSVDNLAPSAPANLVVAATNHLAWDPSPAADFDYYTVYASNEGSLGAGAVKLTTTVAPEADVHLGGHPYYLVTATDFSGNEGAPAVLAAGTVGVGDEPAGPTRFALYPAWPNPAAGGSNFRFDLPHPTRVELSVYDVAGRRVAVLVDAEMPAGTHLVPWAAKRTGGGGPLASGVYFYRMQAGTFRDSGRIVIVR